jgi:hypothetical protein
MLLPFDRKQLSRILQSEMESIHLLVRSCFDPKERLTLEREQKHYLVEKVLYTRMLSQGAKLEMRIRENG